MVCISLRLEPLAWQENVRRPFIRFETDWQTLSKASVTTTTVSGL
jgi:hypothetical protein